MKGGPFKGLFSCRTPLLTIMQSENYCQSKTYNISMLYRINSRNSLRNSLSEKTEREPEAPAIMAHNSFDLMVVSDHAVRSEYVKDNLTL